MNCDYFPSPCLCERCSFPVMAKDILECVKCKKMVCEACAASVNGDFCMCRDCAYAPPIAPCLKFTVTLHGL